MREKEHVVERWLRAIRSRKLAMHAVSLHNRKLDTEKHTDTHRKREREREGAGTMEAG